MKEYMQDLIAKWIVPSHLQYETCQLTISILRLLRKNGSRKHKKKHGSKFDNKNTSQVFINNLSNNLLGSTAFGYTILPCQFAQPASSGIANEGQNIQNVTIPADQRPFLNFTKLRGGGSSYRGPGVDRLEEGVDTAQDLPEIKVITMLIV